MANSMTKIQMCKPIVEIDGDEMTRVLWALVKEKLLMPFIDLKSEYYDLSLSNRSKTNDSVTLDAAVSILQHGVGVKCATITANTARQKEYNLEKLIPSPNATIRAILDGTVFRKPITVSCIKPTVTTWKKPIVISRHAYGDVYKNVEMQIERPGKVELVFTDESGKEERKIVQEMKTPGIVQSIHNYDESIRSFARSCFYYALAEKIDVWFSTKDTISQIYDARFKTIFNEVYQNEFKEKCSAAGIKYFYTLIDDAVARLVQSEGGFLLACKNYDGDVLSDLVASACGSLAMMTSALTSPSGVFLYEAAHGTVQKHFYRYKNGEKTSTNPTAIIFAWTGALAKRGSLDGLQELVDFARNLENAVIATIERGKMTKDLFPIASIDNAECLDSWQFIDAVFHSMKNLHV
ncbi:MAG: NADP-dependent isocitrate dehydrogenase [Termitinemataceae bacterium]|nr:MAG: NADP-dependent isocitrate dehydrogenase [Termitinemataceae bacterium]